MCVCVRVMGRNQTSAYLVGGLDLYVLVLEKLVTVYLYPFGSLSLPPSLSLSLSLAYSLTRTPFAL